jgi:CRISPR-associated protein Csb2
MSGFALGIRYLNGWAMAAADGAKKETAEWPPHPERVFLALAAAWFETGQDPEEGDALRWLEALPPPGIVASDASFRTASKGSAPPVSYVPVNDAALARQIPRSSELAKLKEAGLDLLPEHRGRQPRSFPVAIPVSDHVYLTWSSADLGPRRHALDRLARNVTHIGHSASFTQVWVEDHPPDPNWVPREGTTRHRLRVFSSGRLANLGEQANHEAIRAYASLCAQIEGASGKTRNALKAELANRFGNHVPVTRRPEPSLWAGYDRPTQKPLPARSQSVFDPSLLILAIRGRSLSLRATLSLTEALRGAVQKHCPAPIPEWVSGHAPDRSATTRPHLAFVPLPFVDAEHADGRILGAALVLPRGLDSQEAARCLDPLLWGGLGVPRAVKLYEGEWLECTVTLEQREVPPHTLRAGTWTTASTVWVSVTPVVLDRHFSGPDKWDRAAESIKDSCERIGLPRPKIAELTRVSPLRGVPHAREFAAIKRKSDGGDIHHSHATLVFDEPVLGPVIVGAGRYRGYGLFHPRREGENG